MAIMVITILGVTMFSGLQAACMDLRVSADRFFDGQMLHDLQIQSTLGLTQEDVEVLQGLDVVEKAEGIYAETVQARIGEQDFSLSLQTMTESGMDCPYVCEGRLPEKANECVVTEKFTEDTGLVIGDVLTIQEDLDPGDEDSNPEEPSFPVTEYTITGIVVDVTDVDNPSGPTSYRSSTIKDLTVLILPGAVETDVYTSVLVQVKGAEELFCFGEDYEERIAEVRELLNGEIKYQREKARYEQVISDAEKEIAEAEAEVNAELADALQQLQDGEAELAEKLGDAWQELVDGEKELSDGASQIKDAFTQIAAGKKQLDAAEKKLDAAEKQIQDGLKQIEDGRKQLEEAQKQIDAGKAELEAGRAELEAGKKQLEEQEKSALTQLQEAKDMLASMSKAAGKLSSQADKLQKEAEELTGESFPEKAYDQAVESMEEKLTPALEKAMAEMDLSSMDTEQIRSLVDQLGEEDADAETLTKLLQENLSQEEAQELLSQLYASAKELSAEEWEEILSDAADSSAALASLSAAYDAAAAEESIQLQRQIDQLRTADPQPEDAQEQIEALEKQQEEIAQAALTLPGAAAEKAAARALKSVLASSEKELEEQESSAKAQIAAARERLEAGEKELEAGEQELIAGQQEIDANRKKLEENEQLLKSSQTTIDQNRSLIESSRATLEKNEKLLKEKQQELSDGRKKLSDGWEEYYKGKEEGEAKLADGWSEYYDGVQEAEDAFAEAREKLSEIDVATWYVWDRTSLSGYNNIKSDAGSIEGLASVFPVLFFVIAVLISLTTITRMVEEDRGLIGTYKALGYSDARIRRKYSVYAGAACVVGSLIGTVCAFIVLPVIVCYIFRQMYLLPYYVYVFMPAYGLSGPGLFLLGVVGATVFTCSKELKITPAILMRPKAPASGNRVFLEYIPLIWNRMSFLNKVTARNLFRYKKRMLMTIGGIAGCMALLLFGYAVKDTVHDLMPNQYEKTFTYDVMTVVAADDNEALLSYINGDEEIAEYTNLEITSVTLSYGEESLDIQLFVFPDEESIRDYVDLHSPEGEAMELKDGDVLVTLNAANVLGFEGGDEVSLQLLDLQKASLPVSGIAMNHLSNYVYMTAETFEKYYDAYEPNAVLMNFAESCKDEESYVEELKKKEGILTCLYTTSLKENFTSAFILINMVVYVIIIMSAALAFVVLFTLSTTNISERERELATIKVLGFYDREVHLYVDKETLLLTGIGILLGIPLGRAFAGTLTVILNLPSIYLDVTIHPISYGIAAGLSLLFALMVSFIMDKTLDRIDPVQALKSIE